MRRPSADAGQLPLSRPGRCRTKETGNAKLTGYALDGFGIYSTYDAHDNEMANADLGACHGRTSPMTWNRHRVSIYHYVLAREYHYAIGCFRGAPLVRRFAHRRLYQHSDPMGGRAGPSGRRR